MTKEQKQKLEDNFDEENIANIRNHIETGGKIPEMVGMFINESGNGEKIRITSESRKKSAEALLEINDRALKLGKGRSMFQISNDGAEILADEGTFQKS